MADFPAERELGALRDGLGDLRREFAEAAGAAAAFETQGAAAFTQVAREQQRGSEAAAQFSRSFIGAFEDIAVHGRSLSTVLEGLARDLTRFAVGQAFSGFGGGSAGEAAPANITFNVRASDAPSFQKSETQIAAMLARASARGARNL